MQGGYRKEKIEMNNDHSSYYKFTSKSRLDKAINSLVGIVEGIAIDGIINNSEVSFLTAWLSEHNDFRDQHPFNELFPVIAEALYDGVITEDERLDILWLCENLRSTEYYNTTTADIQRLHGIIGAIASDGVITEKELVELSNWLDNHEYLRKCWPYDEIDSLIAIVLADKQIDENEHQMLLSFFDEFIDIEDKHALERPLVSEQSTIQGLCAVSPEITIEESKFCFTGASSQFSRKQFAELISNLGGYTTNSISKSLDYLVIGAEGNPCWAYACYGRKVEAAVNLRKQGYPLLLVHEHDLHQTIANL